jgi:hypothetical protein
MRTDVYGPFQVVKIFSETTAEALENTINSWCYTFSDYFKPEDLEIVYSAPSNAPVVPPVSPIVSVPVSPGTRMAVTGDYTGASHAVVFALCTVSGVPGTPARFRVTWDGGTTWIPTVDMDTDPISIGNGLFVSFNSPDAGNSGDEYFFSVSPAGAVYSAILKCKGLNKATLKALQHDGSPSPSNGKFRWSESRFSTP